MSARALRVIEAEVLAMAVNEGDWPDAHAAGKQVMLGDVHFADARDEIAAATIVAALHESGITPHALRIIARKIGAQAEMIEQGVDE
jgi:hypothetical protein